MSLLQTHAVFGDGEPAGLSAVHSGNMGDIVYAVPTIRALGIETLYLNTVSDPGLGRRKLTCSDATFIAPLIRELTGVKRVIVVGVPIRLSKGVGAHNRDGLESDGLPLEHIDPEAIGIDYILDRFRLEPADRLHLIDSHARAVGLSPRVVSLPVPIPDSLSEPVKEVENKILLSLTPRARFLPGPYFAELLAGRDDVIQVGAPNDSTSFEGIPGRFHTAKDAIELARMVVTSKLFIGSQSMPAALAEILGQPRLLDVPSYPVVGFPRTDKGLLLPPTPAVGRSMVEAMLQGDTSAAALLGGKIPSRLPKTRSSFVDPDSEVAVYWRDRDEDYHNTRAARARSPVGMAPRRVTLRLSARSNVAALRIHPVNKPAIIAIDAMVLRNASGKVLWRFDPTSGVRENSTCHEALLVEEAALPLIVIQLGERGWFELPLPAEAHVANLYGAHFECDLRLASDEETRKALLRQETEKLQLNSEYANTKQALEQQQAEHENTKHALEQEEVEHADTRHELEAERAFSVQKNEALDAAQATLEHERIARARADARADAFINSTSWRITSPLRSAVQITRKTQNYLPVRRNLRALWHRWRRQNVEQLEFAEITVSDAQQKIYLDMLLTLCASSDIRFPLAQRFYAHELNLAGVEIPMDRLLPADTAIRLAIEANRSQEVAALTYPTVSLMSPIEDGLKTVSIVVCVHNALDDVRRCLDSVICHFSSTVPIELILVDDGSAEETKSYLARFAKQHDAILIRHDVAQGYTAAANAGIERSTADLTILLNSDTITTAGWIEGLLACANSDRRIGFLGPLSNTASWQSVPEIFDPDGDWAENPVPDGLTLQRFAHLIKDEAKGPSPLLGFINGFCFAIKRAVIQEIGAFSPDFANFGEENDFCLRAAKKGWLGAVAHEVYVYHAQSKSYSHERRAALVAKSDNLLREHHPPEVIAQLAQGCARSLLLSSTRARVAVAPKRNRISREGLRRFAGRRVVFLLPAVDGGGVAVIIQEAIAMVRMGVAVEIVNLKHLEPFFRAANNFSGVPIKVVGCDSHDGIVEYLQSEKDLIDAVICTHNSTVDLLCRLSSADRPFSSLYYVQDFEPYFYQAGSDDWTAAMSSYTQLPELKLITKTRWNARMLEQEAKVRSERVGPSVDLDTFRPLREKNEFGNDTQIAVAAMIRPSTPRRAPERTYAALERVALKFKGKVQVYSFGCSVEELEKMAGRVSPTIHHLGVLDRPRIARLLGELDIFLDLSHFQAMGLTALEAMASGCVVIGPAGSGMDDFVVDGESGRLIDVKNDQEVDKALVEIVVNTEIREEIQRNATRKACQFSCEAAAYAILQAAFKTDSAETQATGGDVL